MTNNKIQMPANFVALNENEMSCVEGGGIVSQICYAFGRMFRSTFHTTPHQFLLELRVQRAKQLLATTTVPIAEIAAQCGFPIPSHFTTTFRSRTGVTPTEYRRNA